MIKIEVTGANAQEVAQQIADLSIVLGGQAAAKATTEAPAKEEKKTATKAAEKAPAAAPKEEPKEEPKADLLEESKTILVRHSKKGNTPKMKQILSHVGVAKLTDADEDQLAQLHELFTKYDKLAKTGEVDMSDLGIENVDDLV